MSSFKSAIYNGSVHHRRNVPQVHQFRYSLYMLYLDLDELEQVFAGRWLWGLHRFTAFRFRREDHLGSAEETLKESVQDLVQKETGKQQTGPVRLLTNLRCWGYLMNPVCFYYCFDATDSHVQAIVAEVSNTPWGERHCYVLDCGSLTSGKHRETQQKVFHVSPFMKMNMHYHWTISAPADELSVAIVNEQAGETIFSASLSLQRQEINNWTLFTTSLKHPWMTGKIVTAIYWNALRLWWKGIAYVPHPKPKTTGG